MSIDLGSKIEILNVAQKMLGTASHPQPHLCQSPCSCGSRSVLKITLSPGLELGGFLGPPQDSDSAGLEWGLSAELLTVV